MALTEENGGGNGFFMPVAPAYGGFGGNNNGGFGGDWGWIILLLLLAGGGWGNGFGGGFGGGFGNMMLGMDFPWLMNGQQGINNNVSSGFRDAQLNDGITSIRDGLAALSTQLCGCCGDMQMALANGFANVEQGANARQMADMQQAFASQIATMQGFNGVQNQLANCCCENRAGIADLKYTVASEECATRANSTQNTQSVLNLVNSGIQSIKDQMCQDKIDAKNEKIADLERQLTMANLAASQIAQDGRIINGVYDRLSTCPVGTVPVFGEQPIFRCNNNNNGCGCGCGSF